MLECINCPGLSTEMCLECESVNGRVTGFTETELVFDGVANTDLAAYFRLTGLYALNRIDQPKFNALMSGAHRDFNDTSYLQEKWESFIKNQLSFMVCDTSFTAAVVQEIIDSGYTG